MVGFIRKLFGLKESSNSYTKAGLDLIPKIADSIGLKNWQIQLQGYTPEESEAIQKELSNFQKITNETLGDKALFHPDAVEPIQRIYTSLALRDLANNSWKSSNIIPENFKGCVLTYIKAWVANLDPEALSDMAEFLLKVGYKSEARAALQVILLFPNYSEKYFSGVQKNFIGNKSNLELTKQFVQEAKQKLEKI